MTMEMRETIWTLMETEGFSCEVCPFAAQCEAEELWWGCGQWEDEMGEDL